MISKQSNLIKWTGASDAFQDPPLVYVEDLNKKLANNKATTAKLLARDEERMRKVWHKIASDISKEHVKFKLAQTNLMNNVRKCNVVIVKEVRKRKEKKREIFLMKNLVYNYYYFFFC